MCLSNLMADLLVGERVGVENYWRAHPDEAAKELFLIHVILLHHVFHPIEVNTDEEEQ